MRKSLIQLVFCATLAGAMPAYAGPVFENGTGGTFNYYGQLDFAYTSFDDGADTTGQFVDNAASNSRVGFYIHQPFGDNELTFRFETGLGLAASDSFSQISDPDDLSWDRTKIRHADLIYKTARYGTLYAGQGSMASDGAGNIDVSGTSLASPMSMGDIVGSFLLRDSTGNLTNVNIGSVFVNFDGPRAGRVRYDTPTYNGFNLSLAAGEDILTSGSDDEFYDVALRYAGEFNGAEIKAGLGYQERHRPGAPDREDTFASLGVKLSNGFNFSTSIGDRSTAGNYVFFKVGYQADWWSVGSTALSVDVFSGSDAITDGDDAESWGLAAVQKFDDLNLEAYVGYRDYSYSDNSATTYQDASSFIVGARWKF